jgi:hypothetical protein
MSELGEDACAVRAVGGHLTLLVVGEVGQSSREVEDWLRQSHLEQEADGTQTQGQQRQRGPGRAEWADVTVQIPTDGRRGPPLSPVSPLAVGRRWWRGP